MTQQTVVTNPPNKSNSTKHLSSRSLHYPRATNKTSNPALTPVKSCSPSPNPTSLKTTKLAGAEEVVSQIATSSPASNKQALLIGLMERPEGISLSEMMNLSSWQAHSVRGWISGTLRNKLGLVVTRFKSESGETCYRIQPASSVYAASTSSAAC